MGASNGFRSNVRLLAGLGWVVVMSLVLTGQDGCQGSDEDGDGWTTGDGDCDDADASIYPGASEVCDGLDNDCDGVVDEDAGDVRVYVDQDGDGFGTEPSLEVPCDAVPPYHVLRRGDCNDANASIHPGASDAPGDWEDSDCGGSLDPDPHVGLGDESFDSIQQALDAAQDGTTIWVGPGIYLEHDITFRGKQVHLASTDGAARTRVDAGGQGSVFRFESGEGPAAQLDGFTLTGGHAELGGGLFISGSSPSVTGCTVTGNVAESDCVEAGEAITCHGGVGGGLFIATGRPRVSSTVVSGNEALGRCGTRLQGGELEVVCGGGDGAGIYLTDGMITLDTVMVEDNEGWGDGEANSNVPLDTVPDGAGLFAENSEVVVLEGSFRGNLAHEVCVDVFGMSLCAGGNGGGLALFDSVLTMSGTWVGENEAESGGGLALEGTATGDLTSCTIQQNAARDNGGGILLADTAALAMVDSVVTGNRAPESGGGVNQDDTSSLTLTHGEVTGNSATWGGGVATSMDSVTDLAYILFSSNTADYGGGLHSVGDATITHCNFVDNVATGEGGGIFRWYGSVSVDHTIFAFNVGYEIYDLTDASNRIAPEYCALWTPYGDAHNLLDIPDSTLEVDPGFLTFSPDGDPSNDDLHLQLQSPLVNAGAPTQTDPDGSRADIGIYGGPDADWSGYRDLDDDGMYDAWELDHGLDPSSPDGSRDLDGDGLTNLQEFELGTDPETADSDRDGFQDDEEIRRDADPLNPCSRPGSSTLVPVEVPGDYATIQEAIDAIPDQGIIEVAPGTYVETPVIRSKRIELLGPRTPATLNADGRDSALTVLQSEFALSGFHLENGHGSTGGGLELVHVAGTVENVTITDCRADRGGGGIHILNSDLDINRLSVTGNHAESTAGGMWIETSSVRALDVTLADNDTSGLAGGLRVDDSDPTFENCTISGNAAESSGGGAYLDQANPTFTRCVISDNGARDGAGMSIHASDPAFVQTTFEQNQAQEEGGGVWIGGGGWPDFYLCVFESNSADMGAGIYADYASTFEMDHCRFTSNTASSDGGALYMSNTSSILSHSVVTGNEAHGNGGGVQVTGASGMQIVGSILAYNQGGNLYVAGGTPHVTYSDLYNPAGMGINVTGVSLETGCLTVDPLFLAYDTDGLPRDLHLALASPLIDAADPAGTDPDGSPGDMGIYGGTDADQWDRDGDAIPDYFWPGTIDDAPPGFSPSDYDCDDTDPTVQACL